MWRRLISLLLVVTLSFGFAPSALAHDGDHSAWEGLRLAGSGVAFLVTTIVTRRITAPANVPPLATRIIQTGTGAAGAGNVGGFYQKYFSHVVDIVNKGFGDLMEGNSRIPNLLYGARP